MFLSVPAEPRELRSWVVLALTPDSRGGILVPTSFRRTRMRLCQRKSVLVLHRSAQEEQSDADATYVDMILLVALYK